MKTNIDAGILTWRLTLGVLMLMHGIYKLINGLDYIEGLLMELGLPKFFALGVHVGEIIAPLLLIVGYRTKIAAIIYAFTMIVAVFMSHSHEIFQLGQNGAWAIELNALFLFGAVGLIFTGAGKYSIDYRLGKKAA